MISPEFIAVLAAMLVTGSFVIAEDILHRDTKTPLFTIYELEITKVGTGDGPRTHEAKVTKTLLTVTSLRDLLLQKDQKGVRVILNAKDTKAFTEITGSHEYLALMAGEAGEAAGVTMHITGQITDGSITFDSAHQSESVAKVLRDRFGLKFGSNEVPKKDQNK